MTPPHDSPYFFFAGVGSSDANVLVLGEGVVVRSEGVEGEGTRETIVCVCVMVTCDAFSSRLTHTHL